MRPDDAARPHIAFFLPHLGGGGAEKMVSTLASGLAARGYRVHMVLVQAVGIHLEGLSKSVRVVDLHARSSYLAVPALVSYLRRERPYVFVPSLPLTNLLAIIAHALVSSDIRLAIRIENMTSAQRRSAWKKMLEKRLLSWLYPRTDCIIAVSHAVAQDAERYLGIPASRFNVIYNPVLRAVRPPSGSSEVVHPWFAAGSPPVILAVGRLSPAKDFPTLLRALAEVNQQRPVRLIILGEGEEQTNLRSLARELQVAEDVDFPGFVSSVDSFMQMAAVFVLSSLYEGLPTVLIEALANGCAAISTDCPGGSREILADGAYGDLVPVGDPHAIASAICGILDGRRKPVDPGWLQQFTLETVLDQTVAVLGLPSVTAST